MMILATNHARERAHSRYAIDVSVDDTVAEHVAIILAGQSKRLKKQPGNGEHSGREVHAVVSDGRVYVCVWSPGLRRIITYLPSGG
jgi:hypothetical protein